MLSRSLACTALVALLAACGGSDQAASTPAAGASDSAAASSATPAPTVASTAGNGEVLYARCVICHMANGEGTPGAFPPLAGSEWVNGPAARPIAIVLHGLEGPITVKGATYASAMMPYGTNVPMSDAEVAAVLTYVRSSFGNSAPAVTEEEVAKVRAATASHTGPMNQKALEALQ
jgi:mono/diheme cytochrome c family protein